MHVTAAPEIWLDAIARPESRLTVSHYGYSDHALQATPIRDRSLDVHLLWFVVDHGFAGDIGADRIFLEPGSLLWIRPGAVHSFTIPKGLRTYHLRVDLVLDGRRLTLDPGWIHARGAWELRPVLEELLGELQVQSDFRERRLKQLVGAICLLALRRLRTPATTTAFSPAQRFRIQKLAIEAAGDLTIGDLAAELRLSPVYFSRVFKQTFGIPPRAWLVRERLRQAANLLTETNNRISEVARACGFQDPNLFSRQFRRVYRQSPRDYRRGSTGS